MPADRFANYVPVAERVSAAAGEIQLLQSDPPVMLTDVLGYIRVTVTLVDGRTATGIAQFRLDALHGAQKTNPLEDAETSAVGRALAFLGYSANRGIASREDVQRAVAAQQHPSAPAQRNPDREAAIDELKAARQELRLMAPDRLDPPAIQPGQLDTIGIAGIRSMTERTREAINAVKQELEATVED